MTTAPRNMTPVLSTAPPRLHSDLQRISLWLPTMLVAVSMLLFLIISFVMYHYRHVKRKRATLDYMKDHDDVIRSSLSVQPFSVSDTCSDFENATFDLVGDGGESFVSIEQHRQKSIGGTSGGGVTESSGGQRCRQGTPDSSPRRQLYENQVKTSAGCSIITHDEDITLDSQGNRFIRETEASVQGRNGLDSKRMCANDYVDVESSSTDELISPIEVYSSPADDVAFTAARYQQDANEEEADKIATGASSKELKERSNHKSDFHWHSSGNDQTVTVRASSKGGSCQVSNILGASQHSPLCVVCLVTQARLRPVGLCSSCSNMNATGNLADVLSLIGHQAFHDTSRSQCPTSSASYLPPSVHQFHPSRPPQNEVPNNDNSGCPSFSSFRLWNPNQHPADWTASSHPHRNNSSAGLPQSYDDGEYPSSSPGLQSASQNPYQHPAHSVSKSIDDNPGFDGIDSSHTTSQSSQNLRSLDERHMVSDALPEACVYQTAQSLKDQDNSESSSQAHCLSEDGRVPGPKGRPSPGTLPSENTDDSLPDSSVGSASEVPSKEKLSGVESMLQAVPKEPEAGRYNDSIFPTSEEQCVSPAFSDNFSDLPPSLWDALCNTSLTLSSGLQDAVPMAGADNESDRKPTTDGHEGELLDSDSTDVVNRLESQWLVDPVSQATYITHF